MGKDVEGKDSRRRYWGKKGALIKAGVDVATATRIARAYAGGKTSPKAGDSQGQTIGLPYRSIPELPPEVRDALPPEAAEIWRQAFNQAYEDTEGNEEAAFRIAWAAVRRAGYRKEGRRWVKAQEPDGVTYSRLIALDEFLDVEELEREAPVSEIQIARVGTWDHPQYGKLEITEETLQDFVDNFYARVRGIDIAIDQGHRPEEGAAGWFRDLIKRGGELWAVIEWTPLGVQLIRDGIFRYISPEFMTVYTDPETGQKYRNVLLGAALTNRPFIKNMAPVVLEEPREGREEDEQVAIKLSEPLRKRLGIDAEEIEAQQLLAAVERALSAPATVQLDEGTRQLVGISKETVTPEELLKAVQAKLQEAAAHAEANRQLTERVANLETALKRQEWQAYRDAKIREGKLTPALAEKLEPLYLSEPARAKEIIEAMPRVIELGERGTAAAPGEGDGGETPDRILLAEVTKYQREKGVDYATALAAVTAEKPDLVRQYQEYVRGQAMR